MPQEIQSKKTVLSMKQDQGLRKQGAPEELSCFSGRINLNSAFSILNHFSCTEALNAESIRQQATTAFNSALLTFLMNALPNAEVSPEECSLTGGFENRWASSFFVQSVCPATGCFEGQAPEPQIDVYCNSSLALQGDNLSSQHLRLLNQVIGSAISYAQEEVSQQAHDSTMVNLMFGLGISAMVVLACIGLLSCYFCPGLFSWPFRSERRVPLVGSSTEPSTVVIEEVTESENLEQPSAQP